MVHRSRTLRDTTSNRDTNDVRLSRGVGPRSGARKTRHSTKLDHLQDDANVQSGASLRDSTLRLIVDSPSLPRNRMSMKRRRSMPRRVSDANDGESMAATAASSKSQPPPKLYETQITTPSIAKGRGRHHSNADSALEASRTLTSVLPRQIEQRDEELRKPLRLSLSAREENQETSASDDRSRVCHQHQRSAGRRKRAAIPFESIPVRRSSRVANICLGIQSPTENSTQPSSSKRTRRKSVSALGSDAKKHGEDTDGVDKHETSSETDLMTPSRSPKPKENESITLQRRELPKLRRASLPSSLRIHDTSSDTEAEQFRGRPRASWAMSDSDDADVADDYPCGTRKRSGHNVISSNSDRRRIETKSGTPSRSAARKAGIKREADEGCVLSPIRNQNENFPPLSRPRKKKSSKAREKERSDESHEQKLAALRALYNRIDAHKLRWTR